jgi:hypothetical protein
MCFNCGGIDEQDPYTAGMTEGSPCECWQCYNCGTRGPQEGKGCHCEMIYWCPVNESLRGRLE